MTNEPGTDPESLARKSLQVRQLTDPLGAKGFRHPRARLEREGRTRRFAFVAAFAAFLGAFGAIALGADRPQVTADPPATASATASADRVVRQYVVRDANGDMTLIRVLAPPAAPETQVDPKPKPHVRTRSS